MKQKKLYYFVVTLLLCVLFVVGASGVADEAGLLSNQNFAIATAKLIRNNSEKIFTSSNLQIELTGILGKTDGSDVDLTRYNPDNILYCQDGRFYMNFDDAEKLQACLSELAVDPSVIYAIQDCLVYTYADIDKRSAKEDVQQEIAFEPEHEHLCWGSIKMETDAYANYLKSFDNDEGVIVAIIDSGTAEIEYLSDRLVKGYDFVDDETDTSNDTHPTSHGTYLSSIIVDCTPELPVKIMPIRVLSSVSGSLINVINGIYYAADADVDVINISLGGRLSNCQAMDDAINYAINKDISVVACAGNEASDTTLFCPSHNQNVITVSSVDSNLSFASAFSNYGQTIDITSPGVDIFGYNAKGILKKDSGTSMSTAYISACMAMLRLQYVNANRIQLEKALKECALDLGDEGWDELYGYGFPVLSNLIDNKYKWVEGIEITQTCELSVDEIFVLDCVVFPESATNKTINWTSSDNRIVKVENGIITAVSEGEADVIAKTQDGEYQSVCKVTVYPKYAEKIVIVSLPTKLKYKYGENIQLDGMVLQGQYSGSIYKQIDITKCKISAYNPKQIGDQTVVVEYDNSAVLFTVSVERNWWQKIIWILSLVWLFEV